MASRSAVMISGERSANWASSFLRSAGASWAAAVLRWMTRPARSSSTAGSGMPATTALTAAFSTGGGPRTSSREVTTLCNRHGTSAAAAMQTKTAPARSSDNSPNVTSTAKARPAASRIMAECRNRSGQGEKKEEDEESSMAIAPAFFPFGSVSSGAGVPALPDEGGFAFGLGVSAGHRLTQAFEPRTQYNFPKRQQDYRYDKWRNIIEHAEQQHPPQQVVPVHLPQADQHRGIEHAEPAGGMAGEAQ